MFKTIIISATSLVLLSTGHAEEGKGATGTKGAKTAKAIAIQKLDIRVRDLGKKVNGTALSSWQFIFAARDASSFGDTVKRFSDRKELIAYSMAQFGVNGDKFPKSQEISNAVADDLEKKVDFEKNDLAIVYRTTGGPPYGQFTHEVNKQGVLEFLVIKPKHNGPSGMALKSAFEFYAIPKGQKVVEKVIRR